jgi:hypothetical protein
MPSPITYSHVMERTKVFGEQKYLEKERQEEQGGRKAKNSRIIENIFY